MANLSQSWKKAQARPAAPLPKAKPMPQTKPASGPRI